MEKDKINVIPEYMDSIKKSFLEAQQVLADFVADEEKLDLRLFQRVQNSPFQLSTEQCVPTVWHP